jgi:membrane protease subunit HflC
VVSTRRSAGFEPPPSEVIAADQKRIVVDSYVRYRIVDPLQFYQSVGTEEAMQLRLGVPPCSTARYRRVSAMSC